MPSDTVASPVDVLTEVEAGERAARVGGTSYEVALDLQRHAVTFRGEARLRFRLRGEGDLFLDFRGGTIERLEVNGRPVVPERPGHRILLPAEVLLPETEVLVAYENAYDTTGDGFHRFVDPEDGEEYLYTNFEPFEAHRLFPCFDQPDIKATCAFTVTAPAAWTVISNGPAVAVEEAPDGRRVHRFATTPPISTYLTALVAGPYVGVADEHRGIPLGLWCRRSLLRHLDPEELFLVTKQGLDFYADLFDRAYPFAKLDQVFVPEFNPGAMENVGCITHYERSIFRDPPTDAQRRDRAEVVLHEIAHMWFGDLVTMRWWSDLWLNESFATYVSHLALAEATRFHDAWRAFHGQMKRWAYRADQLSTTHPISGPVPDTDATFYNFDGITYGKGAAVIQQLVAAIGMDGFREGMRTYFRRHEWGNATLADFLAALEAGSGLRLDGWARAWLETASLNTIAAVWTARDGRLERLQLAQDAPASHPTLRPHALQVGLVHEGPAGPEVDAIPVRLDGAETWVGAAAGKPVPVLVFPNHGDYAYAKVALDPVSVANLPSLLGRLDDPLLRELLWGALWEMVRDRSFRSTDYLALARDILPGEPRFEIAESVIETALGALASYVPEERRVGEARAFVAAALGALGTVPPGDARIVWLRAAIAAVADAADAALLVEHLDGRRPLDGVEVDQEMRWGIVTAAVAHDLPGALDLLEAERGRDPSDRGERAAIRAAVSRPDPAAKAEAWERIHGRGYGSLHLTRAALDGFNHAHQRDLLAPYVEWFFAAVPRGVEGRDHSFQTAYVRRLFPSYRVESEVAERARAVIALEGERLPTLGRLLREETDELERAIACRAYAAG